MACVYMSRVCDQGPFSSPSAPLGLCFSLKRRLTEDALRLVRVGVGGDAIAVAPDEQRVVSPPLDPQLLVHVAHGAQGEVADRRQQRQEEARVGHDLTLQGARHG